MQRIIELSNNHSVMFLDFKKKKWSKNVNDLGEGRTHDLEINSLTP